MTSKQKNSEKQKSTEAATVVVSESVGNYEKHPFFIKKAKAAKELLQQTGLPKGIGVKAQQ